MFKLVFTGKSSRVFLKVKAMAAANPALTLGEIMERAEK